MPLLAALSFSGPGSAPSLAFVAERFAGQRLDPVGADDGRPFTDEADNETGDGLAIIPGSGAEDAAESLVLAAHIDALARPAISPIS